MSEFQTWLETRRAVLREHYESVRRIPITIILSSGEHVGGQMSEGLGRFGLLISKNILRGQYRET